MGDPRFQRKRYETPTHPWQGDRIKLEREFVFKYGLKNKKEVWKIETFLRRIRGQARRLQARRAEESAEHDRNAMISRLAKLGILPANSTLDDVLALNVENILARRLQTLVYLHGLARTPKQARQLIIHGHIAVNGRRTRVPSYLVKRIEEEGITYSYSSKLNDELHPMRPKAEEKERIAREHEEKDDAEEEAERPGDRKRGGRNEKKKGSRQRPGKPRGRDDSKKPRAKTEEQKPPAKTKVKKEPAKGEEA